MVVYTHEEFMEMIELKNKPEVKAIKKIMEKEKRKRNNGI